MVSHRLVSLLILIPTLFLAACGDTSANSGDSSNGGDGGDGAGGNGGASSGSGNGGDGGEAPLNADPISAPSEEWTWVPFDNAFCANGSTTGIGVNLTDKSDNLVIYLMGGGACWDSLTCYIAKTAVNIESGYGAAQFNSDKKGLNISLFDRNDPANPVRDASFVFVPYCTGDVHAGTNAEASYDGKNTLHVGYRNMQAFLARLATTRPNVKHILLSGSSAGGFGAGINWWQVQKVFGDARVDLVDDSGPPLPAPYLSESIEGQWRAAWSLNTAMPEGCGECQTDLSALFGYYAANLPQNRGALLSYTHDQVIASYFLISQDKVAEGLGILGDKIDTYANMRYYYVDGNSHVLLGNPSGISQNGVVLMTWINQMWNDDPTWVNIKP